MICRVFPRVEGVALDRFRALGKQVMQYQRAGRSANLDELRGREVDWAQHHAGINGAREEYEALARVLIDLAKLRWRVEEDRFGIELVAPREITGTAINMADYKETVRNELAPLLAEQFAGDSARKFIRQMEAPRPAVKKNLFRCSSLTVVNSALGYWRPRRSRVQSAYVCLKMSSGPTSSSSNRTNGTNSRDICFLMSGVTSG
jgi:hypothetical protein